MPPVPSLGPRPTPASAGGRAAVAASVPTSQPATALAARIRREIEGFKAGRVPWKTLDTPGKQVQAMAAKGLQDPAAGRALRT